MKPIITSLLDQDFYKLTILQVFNNNHMGHLEAEYRFFDRNHEMSARVPFPKLFNDFKEEVKKQIGHLATLKFTKKEIKYLDNTGLFDKTFLFFLSNFKFNPKNEVFFDTSHEFGVTVRTKLEVAMMYEIFILAIVNECYFKFLNKHNYSSQYGINESIGINSAKELINKIKSPVAEFGTRRRYSKEHHYKIYETLLSQKKENLLGSSNIYLSMIHGTQPIGTVAHEFIEAFQTIKEFSSCNGWAINAWLKQYKDKLNVFLTDTITTDFFFKNTYAGDVLNFKGLRHDSGDPYIFTNKVIDYYDKLNINPKTKSITFSDSLSTDYALAIEKFCKGKIPCSFGIGTYLTNNIGIKPLNIVVKMIRLDGKPVVKLSDNPRKAICADSAMLEYAKRIVGV
jgi:nicotinate phosphoribosyltransferase